MYHSETLGLLYVTWSAKLTICCEIEGFKLANKFFKTFLLFYFVKTAKGAITSASSVIFTVL